MAEAALLPLCYLTNLAPLTLPSVPAGMSTVEVMSHSWVTLGVQVGFGLGPGIGTGLGLGRGSMAQSTRLSVRVSIRAKATFRVRVGVPDGHSARIGL